MYVCMYVSVINAQIGSERRHVLCSYKFTQRVSREKTASVELLACLQRMQLFYYKVAITTNQRKTHRRCMRLIGSYCMLPLILKRGG